jgi:hypothetical protein
LRIAIGLKNGTKLEGWADERYRGGPENPLTMRAGSEGALLLRGILEEPWQSSLIDTARSITTLSDVTQLNA